MADQPSSVKTTASPRKARLGGLQHVSIVAGIVAAVNEATLRGVLASTLLMAAGPVIAGGFVYEIASMRKTRLAYEAQDRAQFAARLDREAAQAEPDDRGPVQAKNVSFKTDEPDLARKLDAMVTSRDVLVDTFGGDPTTVAPIYARIIKGMLKDDEDAFAAIAAKKQDGSAAAELDEREAKLRLVHQKLARLVRA